MRIPKSRLLLVLCVLVACGGGVGSGDVLAEGLGSSYPMLTTDAKYLYWTSPEGLSRVPLTGGAPATLVEEHWLGAFAVDATTIYWVSYDPRDTSTSFINAMPLEGGPKRVLAETSEYPTGLGFGISEENVYWGSTFAQGGGELDWVPKSGGAVQRLAMEGGLQNFVIDGEKLYSTFTSRTDGGWTEAGIYVTDLNTLTTTQLTSEPASWGLLALNSTDVFWWNPALNAIRAISRSGGTPRTITSGTPATLTADDQHVYWGELREFDGESEFYRNSAVHSTGLSDLKTSVVADHHSYLSSLRVQSGYLYWLDTNHYQIERVCFRKL